MRKHFRLLSVVAGTALWALAGTAIMPGPATGAERGPPEPDMQCVSKDGDTQSVTEGVPVLIVYTVTVKATGQDATGVEVTDILPAGATFNAGSSSGSCSNGAGPVTCVIGNLAKNQEASVFIAIDITPGAGAVVNVASVDADVNSNTDNDGGPGSPCEDRIIPAPGGEAALVCLSKTATPSAVDEGVSTNVLYEVEIQNQSNDTAATNVIVTDTFTIPVPVTAVGNNAACGLTDGDSFNSGDSFVCALGNLAALASATASATFNIANPQAGEVYENDAVGSADDADDTVEQCSAQVTVRVGTGDQGCTPGYWKNHLASWIPTEFDPLDELSTAEPLGPCFGVFDPGYPNGNGHDWWTCDLDEGKVADGTPNAIPDDLLNGLGFPGGCGPTERCDKPGAARILLRAAVAAILNASHPDVAYTMSVADIISDVQDAILSKNRNVMLALAASIDTDNNLGCPLN